MPPSYGISEQHVLDVFHAAYGKDAALRDGQLEAILAILEGKNALVVQKTGWGKSLVYFIAAKLLRQNGSGPIVIISPLLALMNNQIEAANRLGLAASTINSTNKDNWPEIYNQLEQNKIDALIISPERLANVSFMERLSEIRDINLLVIDEAHCISDWGHDFRPDYQRISKLIKKFPSNMTILATTATANDRVIHDIMAQLGNNLSVIRGNLIRPNLAIQINPLQTQEQRLAWLVEALANDPILSQGQGIIYCLTHNTCNAVAEFLTDHGISVLPYYSGLGRDENDRDIASKNLDSFMDGRARILAATVKLGMGYDKSDIRFVIHFQCPQNLISYYQQIGRAGRDGLPSCAILLHGQDDEEILGYFIETAQVAPNLLGSIVNMAQNGVTETELLSAHNVKQGKMREALNYLQINEYLYKDDQKKYRANISKEFNVASERERQERLISTRVREHSQLLEYIASKDCSMGYIAKVLDAPDASDHCGICANCLGEHIVPINDSQRIVREATQYLGTRHGAIKARKQWATRKKIPQELQMQDGWVLCADYYSEAGQIIKKCKYVTGAFSADIVEAACNFLKGKIENNGIDRIVSVPSKRRPTLVPLFAEKLARALHVPYVDAVQKTVESREQKGLLNSTFQEMNIRESTEVVRTQDISGKKIILVDDMVDSRWTFTVIAAKLLESGAAAVYPFALVATGNGD